MAEAKACIKINKLLEDAGCRLFEISSCSTSSICSQPSLEDLWKENEWLTCLDFFINLRGHFYLAGNRTFLFSLDRIAQIIQFQ
jgi:hypothetical protein